MGICIKLLYIIYFFKLIHTLYLVMNLISNPKQTRYSNNIL